MKPNLKCTILGPVANGHTTVANGHETTKSNGKHETESEEEEPLKMNGLHNSIQTVCRV